MNDTNAQRSLGFEHRSGSWLQRIALALTAATLALIAFFFVTVALAAGALLAGVIAVRWWWLTRRLRAARNATGPIEGEYRVIARSSASATKPVGR